jgi:hypothetical protein
MELPEVGMALPEVGMELPEVGMALPEVGMEPPEIDPELPLVHLDLPEIDLGLLFGPPAESTRNRLSPHRKRFTGPLTLSEAAATRHFTIAMPGLQLRSD